MAKLTKKQVRHTFLLNKEVMNMLNEIRNKQYAGSSYSLALRAIIKEYYYEIFKNKYKKDREEF